MKSEKVKFLILDLLKAYAKSTDNDVDDKVVAFVTAGLENIPEDAKPAGPNAAAIQGTKGLISLGINFFTRFLALLNNFLNGINFP